MGEHIDSITNTLSMFIEVGVPTIRFAQKHGAMNLQNLSTVATFFSAVTATTLQFSFDKLDSSVDHAVNSFWFMSLVFSIAAAVNSLLGLTWKQAM
jgi:WD repeat-containing protein 26